MWLKSTRVLPRVKSAASQQKRIAESICPELQPLFFKTDTVIEIGYKDCSLRIYIQSSTTTWYFSILCLWAIGSLELRSATEDITQGRPAVSWIQGLLCVLLYPTFVDANPQAYQPRSGYLFGTDDPLRPPQLFIRSYFDSQCRASLSFPLVQVTS